MTNDQYQFSRPPSAPDAPRCLPKRQEAEVSTIYAGFSQRVMALLLDTFLLLGLQAGGFFLAAKICFAHAPHALPAILTTTVGLVFFFFLTFPWIGAVYFFILHGYCGQTIGKVLMGIQVVGTNGEEQLGLSLSFLRMVGYLTSALPLGVGFLWIAIDKKNRGWHDYIAHTSVIQL